MRERTDRATQAQSETVGVILLFGMTFVAISGVLVMGAPIIDDARENAQLERIQVEFGTLDQAIRESAYTPSSSGASISLSEGGIAVEPESVTVNFTYDNGSGTATATTTPGGLAYEHEDMGVAYQNGGVWTTYRNGGSTVQTPPDITYRDGSLKMNLINFTNAVDVAGSGTTVSVSSQGVERQDDLDWLSNNPLENGTLTIEIGTEYADAWAEYLNSTGMGVTSLSDDEVVVDLRAAPPLFAVEYLRGRYTGWTLPPILGSNEALVYDSRIGNVSAYNYTVDTSGSSIPLPVDDTDIDDSIESPNGGEPPLPGPGTPVTAGDYQGGANLDGHTFDTSSGRIRYLTGSNSIDIIDTQFNTTGGPVEIHIGSSSSVNIQGDISVNGDNPVYIFAEGGVDIDGSTSVDTDGTNLFQVYTSGPSIGVDSSATYNGTIYAPQATVDIQGEVRGAAIGNSVNVGGEYYHDSSLRQAETPVGLNPSISRFDAVERKVALR